MVRSHCVSRRSLSWFPFGFATFLFAFLQASPATSVAGTIRYDLPELLGRYEYGGKDDPLRGRSVTVDTPFDLGGVSSIRLVLEGTVKPGVARGDGIYYEPTRVVLEPSVLSGVGVENGMVLLTLASHQPTGDFRVERELLGPFRNFKYGGCDPEVICSPGPPRHIPVYSFSAWAGASPAYTTQTPEVIDNNETVNDPSDGGPYILREFLDGLIVEVPVVANITEAYAIIEGRSVLPEHVTASTVPEPSGIAIMFGMSSLFLSRRPERAKRCFGMAGGWWPNCRNCADLFLPTNYS